MRIHNVPHVGFVLSSLAPDQFSVANIYGRALGAMDKFNMEWFFWFNPPPMNSSP